MKKLACAAALATMSAAGAAAAADFQRPYYTVPGPLSSYSWTGPYLGVNLGYQWGTVTNNPTRPSGPAGGIQGGYLWQSGRFVFGGEADLQISGASDTFAPWKFSNPWFGTARARAGVTVDNFLIYGAAGLAVGLLQAEMPGLVSESKAQIGWTAGAGVEVGLAPNWSAKIEYLFLDFGTRNFALTGIGNGYQANLLRLGVNYHF
jgi:outer membrane immunogenic protein